MLSFQGIVLDAKPKAQTLYCNSLNYRNIQAFKRLLCLFHYLYSKRYVGVSSSKIPTLQICVIKNVVMWLASFLYSEHVGRLLCFKTYIVIVKQINTYFMAFKHFKLVCQKKKKSSVTYITLLPLKQLCYWSWSQMFLC